MTDQRSDLLEHEPACVAAPLDPALLQAANIHPVTGLATDYLNHFNEITMLIGLVADMPEVMDDIAGWRPLGYEQHFERSGFAGKALAIAAYRAIEPSRREAFEATIGLLDQEILAAVHRLQTADPHAYRAAAEEADRRIAPLVALASGLIHGVDMEADRFAPEAVQDDIDAVLAGFAT